MQFSHESRVGRVVPLGVAGMALGMTPARAHGKPWRMDAIKASASFAVPESALEQVAHAPDLERRGRIELPGVGQKPRSRSAAVAAAISSASSAEKADGFLTAHKYCASSFTELSLRIPSSLYLRESSRVAEGRPQLGRPPSTRAEG